MAGRVIPVTVGGTELLIETMPAVGTEQTSAAGKTVQKTAEAFDQARQAIIEVATSTVEAVKGAAGRAARPDAVEVEFGLKFSATGNVVIAGAAGEASLVVRLTYNGSTQGTSAGG